ncbi:hypothetical protein LTS18_005298, partial [Coniosporium uncinatum]
WGFEQQEVTCAKGGTLPNSVWYIEQNEHPALGPDAEKVNYRNPGFFGKFWELQKVMWRTNAGLVESHAWDSRPPSWPVLRRGINFWGKDHRQIYLIGNPVIWWSSTAAIALFLVVKGIAILRWQRGFNDYSVINFKRFDYEIGTSVLGWAFHYFPFYLMQRQLFLHHYFPALYFAILALAQTYDFTFNRFRGPIIDFRSTPAIGQTAAVAFLALSIVAFQIYSPLAYGNPWTQKQCRDVKLLGTWDYDCNTFHLGYADYASSSVKASGADVVPSSQAPAAPIGQRADEQQQQKQANEAPQGQVTPQAAAPPQLVQQAGENMPGQKIIGREEKIEYRDENGNLLDPEAVKALEGKVSFKTRYETRTRLVDAAGNEIDAGIPVEVNEPAGVAPPHPDAEGRNPETGDANGAGAGGPAAGEASGMPPVVDVSEDVGKERSVEAEAGNKEARPGSEVEEATGKEEL